MSVLDRAILERHSTRMFLPTPVPREVVDEALALAQHAPLRRRFRTRRRPSR
jgi:nitroreductase